MLDLSPLFYKLNNFGSAPFLHDGCFVLASSSLELPSCVEFPSITVGVLVYEGPKENSHNIAYAALIFFAQLYGSAVGALLVLLGVVGARFAVQARARISGRANRRRSLEPRRSLERGFEIERRGDVEGKFAAHGGHRERGRVERECAEFNRDYAARGMDGQAMESWWRRRRLDGRHRRTLASPPVACVAIESGR